MIRYLLKCASIYDLRCHHLRSGGGIRTNMIIAYEDEKVVSYEKINDSEGRLTLGKYAFTLDLELIDGAKDNYRLHEQRRLTFPSLRLKPSAYATLYRARRLTMVDTAKTEYISARPGERARVSLCNRCFDSLCVSGLRDEG